MFIGVTSSDFGLQYSLLRDVFATLLYPNAKIIRYGIITHIDLTGIIGWYLHIQLVVFFVMIMHIDRKKKQQYMKHRFPVYAQAWYDIFEYKLYQFGANLTYPGKLESTNYDSAN